MAQKFLYLVDFWVPFPASEYSGLLAVVGEDDNEVYDILLNWRDDYLKKYDSLIFFHHSYVVNEFTIRYFS